jgi:hypothetical protein
VEGRALRNLGNPLFNSRVPIPADARFLGDERRLIHKRTSPARSERFFL